MHVSSSSISSEASGFIQYGALCGSLQSGMSARLHNPQPLSYAHSRGEGLSYQLRSRFPTGYCAYLAADMCTKHL